HVNIATMVVAANKFGASPDRTPSPGPVLQVKARFTASSRPRTPSSVLARSGIPRHLQVLQRTVDQAGHIGEPLGWYQTQSRQPLQQDSDANARLEPRQGGPDTRMDPLPKGQMLVDIAPMHC